MSNRILQNITIFRSVAITIPYMYVGITKISVAMVYGSAGETATSTLYCQSSGNLLKLIVMTLQFDGF